MISRARPLLGTMVCIRADAGPTALDRAFAAVERVHRLMSAHSGDSELTRINRTAHRRAVRVHAWTYAVLSRARQVSHASGGAFDLTQGDGGASYADVELLDGNAVRLRRPTRLDLGGIAKGFAVDRAVDALRRHGARRGSVNAGGDLRLFGNVEQTVRVRLPAAPWLTVPIARARDRAFATSAAYFGGRLLRPGAGEHDLRGASITVSAPSCVLADALTKAIAVLGPQAGLLRRFDASAFLLDPGGRLYASRS